MWQEYTREKPARRGWTLGSMIVLFVGTLATAWAVTLSHASGPSFEPVEMPSHWPISFAVPRTCHPLEAGSIPQEADGSTRATGYMAFMNDTGVSRSLLLVMFDEVDPDAKLAFIAALFTDADLVPGDPITMGPFTGQWMQQDPRNGLLAVAKSKTGLAVVVQYVSNQISERDVEVFERVCASIELIE